MNNAELGDLRARVEERDFSGIDAAEALRWFEQPLDCIPELLPLANQLRARHKGDWVKICGIVMLLGLVASLMSVMFLGSSLH